MKNKDKNKMLMCCVQNIKINLEMMQDFTPDVIKLRELLVSLNIAMGEFCLEMGNYLAGQEKGKND